MVRVLLSDFHEALRVHEAIRKALSFASQGALVGLTPEMALPVSRWAMPGRLRPLETSRAASVHQLICEAGAETRADFLVRAEEA